MLSNIDATNAWFIAVFFIAVFVVTLVNKHLQHKKSFKTSSISSAKTSLKDKPSQSSNTIWQEDKIYDTVKKEYGVNLKTGIGLLDFVSIGKLVKQVTKDEPSINPKEQKQ